MTLKQISLLEDQIAIGAVESLFAHRETVNELDQLESICNPLIEKEDSNDLNEKLNAIRKNIVSTNLKYESLVDFIHKKIDSETQDLKKTVESLSEKYKIKK